MGNTNRLGDSLARFFHAFTSIFETTSVKASEAADGMADARDALALANEKVKANTKHMKAKVKEALIAYNKLEGLVNAKQAEVDKFDEDAKAAADDAKAAGSGPKYDKAIALCRGAIARKKQAQVELAALKEDLDEAKPNAERARAMLDKIEHMEREAASTSVSLEVQGASNEAQLKLAEAVASWDEDGGAGDLLKNAKDKVADLHARAAAQTEINEIGGPSDMDLDMQLAQSRATRGVDEELAALLGNTGAHTANPVSAPVSAQVS